MKERKSTVFILIMVGSLLAGVAGAGTTDSVEGLQQAAASGLPETRELAAAFNDATAVLNQINTDATYRTRVMDAVSTQNNTLLLSTLKERATTTTLSLEKLDISHSFLMTFGFNTRGGKHVVLCLSSTRTCGKDHNQVGSVQVF